MADKKCDLTELRSLGMQKAQEKVARLREAGIPVSSEVFSDVLRVSYQEAREECTPVEAELTEEKMRKLREICEPCAKRFTVKAAEPPAEVEAEAEVAAGDGVETT